MPMYTYQCDRCKRFQDQLRPVSNRDGIYQCKMLITDDIYCEGALARVPNAVGGGGFKLIGKGFHVNDYRKGDSNG